MKITCTQACAPFMRGAFVPGSGTGVNPLAGNRLPSIDDTLIRMGFAAISVSSSGGSCRYDFR